VLVEVPPDHPIPLADVQWALAGRELMRPGGELTGTVLVPAQDEDMLKPYGAASGTQATLWRSVTPAVLPRPPGRVRSGAERAAAEASAAASLTAALRHAGVVAPVEAVRIQREPFDIKGARADAFAPDRLDRRALRHVEIRFARPVAGPLAIGDGRWLGLGVMQPIPDHIARAAQSLAGIHAFAMAGGHPIRPADAEPLARALRRAVMARAQAVAGRRLRRGQTLPTFFTGHDGPRQADGVAPPAREGHHTHLFFALDPGDRGGAPRLLVIAPHRADRSRTALGATRRRLLDWLDEALDGFDDLRAGRIGRFALAPLAPGDDDALLGRSTIWTSLTPYRPTRHPRRSEDPAASIARDLLREAARRGLPRPAVEVLAVDERPRGGLAAKLRLTFATVVVGPILLGAGSHFGAGLFRR
jgi:CRISPR-associated protein Csb2